MSTLLLSNIVHGGETLAAKPSTDDDVWRSWCRDWCAHYEQQEERLRALVPRVEQEQQENRVEGLLHVLDDDEGPRVGTLYRYCAVCGTKVKGDYDMTETVASVDDKGRAIPIAPKILRWHECRRCGSVGDVVSEPSPHWTEFRLPGWVVTHWPWAVVVMSVIIAWRKAS